MADDSLPPQGKPTMRYAGIEIAGLASSLWGQPDFWPNLELVECPSTRYFMADHYAEEYRVPAAELTHVGSAMRNADLKQLKSHQRVSMSLIRLYTNLYASAYNRPPLNKRFAIVEPSTLSSLMTYVRGSDIHDEPNREKVRNWAAVEKLKSADAKVAPLQVALVIEPSVPMHAAVLIDHRSAHVTVYAAGANEIGGFCGKDWLVWLLASLESSETSFKYRYSIEKLPDRLAPLALQACFQFYRIVHFQGHPPPAVIFNVDTFRAYAMHFSHQIASMYVYPCLEYKYVSGRYFIKNYQMQNRLKPEQVDEDATDPDKIIEVSLGGKAQTDTTLTAEIFRQSSAVDVQMGMNELTRSFMDALPLEELLQKCTDMVKKPNTTAACMTALCMYVQEKVAKLVEVKDGSAPSGEELTKVETFNKLCHDIYTSSQPSFAEYRNVS